jgi:hypothetical protein
MRRKINYLSRSVRYHHTNVIVHRHDDCIIIGYCYPEEHYKIMKINEALHELKCPARLVKSQGQLVLMLHTGKIFDRGVEFKPGVMVSFDGTSANFECCNTNLSMLTLFER